MKKNEVVEYVKKAYNVLNEKNFKKEVLFYALNILARVLELTPKTVYSDNYIVAAIYIATRRPKYHNNVLNLEYFSNIFNISEDEIQTLVDFIIDKLDIIVFPSDKGDIFYLDKEGVEYVLIKAITKSSFNQAIISQVLGIEKFDIDLLADNLSEYLVENLRILPADFHKSCKNLIKILCNEFAER
ncbi:MAG: cyclin family protein [Candidatus Odinarchaeia archaeon]